MNIKSLTKFLIPFGILYYNFYNIFSTKIVDNNIFSNLSHGSLFYDDESAKVRNNCFFFRYSYPKCSSINRKRRSWLDLKYLQNCNIYFFTNSGVRDCNPAGSGQIRPDWSNQNNFSFSFQHEPFMKFKKKRTIRIRNQLYYD